MTLLYWMSLCFALSIPWVVSGDETPYYYEKWIRYFSANKSKPDSLFGYSITYHKIYDKIIVGAPKASKIGAIYSCNIKDELGNCEKLSVSKSQVAVSNSHDFWLGATVNAGRDFLMTCAPRFAQKDGTITGTYGRCYSLDTKGVDDVLGRSLKMMSTVSDKEEYHWNAYPHANKGSYISHELKMDSFGWSSYVEKSGSVVVGGPAMSIGRAMHYPAASSNPDSVQIENSMLEELHKNISFNFGYSITSGQFNGEDVWYAISTPYGSIGKGRVYFFTAEDKLELLLDIDVEDGNVGSLFGASLCSVVLGEGESGLLVGAPASAIPAVDLSGPAYDIGAVYFYTYTGVKFELQRQLIGFKSGGYYGAAIVSLGDLDGDRIDEFAISAPYEDEGRGAVYLYSGAQLLSGVADKPRQRLAAEGSPHQYFGLSLHALNDSDNNGCNELAIGIPGKNLVMLLRCITYVDVDFVAPFPDLSGLSKTLLKSDTSFVYKSCLKVHYYHENPVDTEILIMVKITHPNVTIRGSLNGAISFKALLNLRKESYCNDITVLLPKDANYDFPIEFTFMAAPVQNPLKVEKFNPKLVLLKGNKSLKTVIPTNLLPGSDLSYNVTTTIKDNYLIGSTNNETVTVTMYNAGNKAFGACVTLRMRGVAPAQWARICKLNGEWLTCTPDPPLDRGQHWNITVTLGTNKLTSANSEVEIDAEVLTNCLNRTGESYKNILKLQIDDKIYLKGISSPGPTVKVTRKLLKDTGKQIEHIYSIINEGVTNWKNMIWKISLPSNVVSAVHVGDKHCRINGSIAECVITKLSRRAVLAIKVQMNIHRDSPLVGQILKGNAVVETSIELVVNKSFDHPQIASKHMSLKTNFSIWEEPKVPLWIIIVASLIGLIILFIFIWILHKCGFSKRTKKEELEALKTEIKRQTIRRSMRLRQSTIQVVTGDQERLVQVPEEPNVDNEDMVVTEIDPARAAFEAELMKALKKDKLTTKADVH